MLANFKVSRLQRCYEGQKILGMNFLQKRTRKFEGFPLYFKQYDIAVSITFPRDFIAFFYYKFHILPIILAFFRIFLSDLAFCAGFFWGILNCGNKRNL